MLESQGDVKDAKVVGRCQKCWGSEKLLNVPKFSFVIVGVFGFYFRSNQLWSCQHLSSTYVFAYKLVILSLSVYWGYLGHIRLLEHILLLVSASTQLYLNHGLQYRTTSFSTVGMYQFDRGPVRVVHCYTCRYARYSSVQLGMYHTDSWFVHRYGMVFRTLIWTFPWYFCRLCWKRNIIVHHGEPLETPWFSTNQYFSLSYWCYSSSMKIS